MSQSKTVLSLVLLLPVRIGPLVPPVDGGNDAAQSPDFLRGKTGTGERRPQVVVHGRALVRRREEPRLVEHAFEMAEKPEQFVARRRLVALVVERQFGAAFGLAPPFVGKDQHGLPFLPVTAQGRAERLLLHDLPMPALQFAVAADPTPMSKDAYQKMMAAHAAATLVQWLDAAQRGDCGFADAQGGFRPLSTGDIAILVRTGSEAKLMRDALQSRGLASVYLSDRDSVYASPEAHDLLLWLHACAEPGSDRAMRAAYSMAGIKPEDVNVAEVHDCFTVMGALGTEVIGKAEPGQGAVQGRDEMAVAVAVRHGLDQQKLQRAAPKRWPERCGTTAGNLDRLAGLRKRARQRRPYRARAASAVAASSLRMRCS